MEQNFQKHIWGWSKVGSSNSQSQSQYMKVWYYFCFNGTSHLGTEIFQETREEAKAKKSDSNTKKKKKKLKKRNYLLARLFTRSSLTRYETTLCMKFPPAMIERQKLQPNPNQSFERSKKKKVEFRILHLKNLIG